ncbi:MAG: metal-dependent hydrolase, beta-lactamase superfamily III [Candidatus Nanosalina sp. J07AB43]|jgi:Metal-dependent hydrolases of the beta-lactamase superfamily III|nr:MAG: metal-dependent hydrolase, beta-lactamase superfamily III [Candidatus Nanosalina sp. J07AB43]
MIDTGTGSTRNLKKSGYSVDELDAVVNTHRHPDHISDLVPIIQDKVVRSFSQEEPDLKLFGPEGYLEYLKDRMSHEMVESPSSISEFGFELGVNEIQKVQEMLQGVEMSSVEAVHGPDGFECLSLRFEARGKSVVFTGDTDYNSRLEEFAEDADILVTDCSCPAGESVEGHMNSRECARLASRAEVSHLVLSHLYPKAQQSDLQSEASEVFSGEITVAEDQKEIGF